MFFEIEFLYITEKLVWTLEINFLEYDFFSMKLGSVINK